MLAMPCSRKKVSFSASWWAVRKRRRASSVAPLMFRISPRARFLAMELSPLLCCVGEMAFGLRHPRRKKRGKIYLLNDPMLDGVPGKLRVAVDAHFFHDIVAMI